MAGFPHGAPPVRMVMALLMYKQGVPRRLRFWLIMMFVLFYQLSGAVYLASISQIQGDLAYISEDVTMASYCSLIGLNIIFPVLFRWKFYFFTRQMWFVSSIACMLSAIAAMYVEEAWLLWIVCLIAGYFKMMGMFACISSSQLNMTPTRNFGVFLPVIYVFVLGAIRISDITATWLAYFYNWKMMYLVVVVMMLIIDAVVYFMMKPDHRSGPFVPLKGVDWIGQLLWTATCVAATYVFNYGEHYDWWESSEIWTATWVFIVLALITLIWTKTTKDPFISPKAFSFPITYFLMVILFGVAIISGLAHYVQPIYVNGVLGYDSINAIDLNYPQLAGIIMGAIFAYFALVRLKWSMRQYMFVNISLFTMYAATMYFIATPFTSKEILYIPAFILAMGEVMMETGATYFLSQNVAFPVFFMNITIIGFVRCGTGTSAAAAIIERAFAWNADQYHIMDSIRECFGIGVWVCIAMILLVLMSNFKATGTQLVPKIMTMFKVATSHK